MACWNDTDIALPLAHFNSSSSHCLLLQIIAGKLGYVPQVHGSSTATATAVKGTLNTATRQVTASVLGIVR